MQLRACGEPVAHVLPSVLSWLPLHRDVVEQDLVYEKLIAFVRSDAAFMLTPDVLPLLLAALLRTLNTSLAVGERVLTSPELAATIVSALLSNAYSI